MSGIAGIIHFDGRPVDVGQIESMTTEMGYRGPDGINHWTHGFVALGQCMLRTTPESLEETQPLKNDDASLILVMDGRIDNWEELRRDLLACGAQLRTRADAELVLRAYEAWGDRCLEHIDGDFALAIWDERSRSLWCARDHIGSKPFFYHAGADRFYFASEPAAFRNIKDLTLTADTATVAEYIANDWVSNTATFWREVSRLPRATAMRVNSSGIRQCTYWIPSLDQVDGRSADDYCDEYRATLQDVSRRMMRSHKPLAFEVSGGLDSSALFAMADHSARNGRLPAPSFHGFTLDFSGDGEANELAYVDAVATHLQRPIERIEPSLPGLAYYRELADKTLDFPGYPNGLMALAIRQRAATLGCGAIFSGTGGDEWLGLMYDGLYLTEEVAAWDIPHLRHAFLDDATRLGTPQALYRLMRHGLYPNLPDRLRGKLRWLRNGGKASTAQGLLRGGELQTALAIRRSQSAAPSISTRGRVAQRMLRGVLHASYDARARESEERIAALHGLELRWTFHNRKIIQLAFSLPERFRTRLGMTKLLHRQAMRGLLPEVVRMRPDKADFMQTFTHTMAGLPRQELLALEARRRGWLQQTPTLHRELAQWMVDPASVKDEWRSWSLLGCDLLLQSRNQ